jgi:hypothetical protein
LNKKTKTADETLLIKNEKETPCCRICLCEEEEASNPLIAMQVHRLDGSHPPELSANMVCGQASDEDHLNGNDLLLEAPRVRVV